MKYFWSIVIFLIVLTSSISSANEVFTTVKVSKGTFVSLNAYIAAKKDTVKTLQLGTNWIVSGKCTVPSTIDLFSFTNNARIYGLHGSSTDTIVIYRMSAKPLAQIFDSSITVKFDSGSIDRVKPEWFGVGSIAIQRAGNSIATTGGVIEFNPNTVYHITTQINFTSLYPISLLSNMAATWSATPSYGYISIDAPMVSVFNFTTYGGTVRGLWIRDPTSNLNTSAQGTNTVTSVFKMTRFHQGVIDQCSFDGVRGSAIELNYWIRGHISNLHIRDCGTYTTPTIWFNGIGAQSIGQIEISFIHAEVCRGDYIKIDSNAHTTKITVCQFECDPNIDSSNNYYINNRGTYTNISHCGFNRNRRTQVFGYAGLGNISNCQFASSEYVSSPPALVIEGNFYNVTNCDFVGTPATKDTAINDKGGNNFFNGCQMYYSGSVYLGNYSTWTGGGFYNIGSTKDYALFTSNSNIVTGAMFYSNDSCGGLYLGINSIATGNVIKSNGKIGLYCQASSSIAANNMVQYNTGGNIVAQSTFPRTMTSNSNMVENDSLPVLQYEATYDPPNLTVGASTTFLITIAGAVVGDVAIASFPAVNLGSTATGMQLNASVICNTTNCVAITFTNNSNCDINLDSGLLTVKVVRK